jgi:predicted TIM-barrel fold metal-dependent hydrolase
MVFDVHAHLWPASETTNDLKTFFEKRKIGDRISSILSAEGILQAMEETGINLSIVSTVALHTRMKNEELSGCNRYISAEVKKTKGKLLSLCTIDPFGEEESVNMLKKSIEELGFRGLKLHPVIQQFYPNNRRLYPIYETMQNYRMPILFHSGGIGIVPFKDSLGRPSLIDDVACDFPELPIIIGHGGRIWYDETAMLLRKHTHVYADISTNIGRFALYKSAPLEWMLYKVKVWAGGLEKVLFGSDYPFYFQKETLESLEMARDCLNKNFENFITDDDMKGIIDENPKKFCERYRLST